MKNQITLKNKRQTEKGISRNVPLVKVQNDQQNTAGPRTLNDTIAESMHQATWKNKLPPSMKNNVSERADIISITNESISNG